MKGCFGYYYNIYDEDGTTDIYIIMNEANFINRVPDAAEFAAIDEAATAYFDSATNPTKEGLESVIDALDLECLEFGFQIVGKF